MNPRYARCSTLCNTTLPFGPHGWEGWRFTPAATLEAGYDAVGIALSF
jgi:hypothetical protein